MSGKEKGIHIVAEGFEYDRIMAPIMGKYPISKLFVLKAEEDEDYPLAKDLTEHFVDKIKDNPLDVEIVPADIYDFEDVFLKTCEIIEDEGKEGKPIYLNISSAPKLALVAMISAAFLSRKYADIEIFYVSPEDYITPDILHRLSEIDDEDGCEDLKDIKDVFLQKGTSSGVSSYEEIPLFPLSEVSDLDKKILGSLLDNQGAGSIKELLDDLEESEGEEFERSTVQYRINKLDDKGLIDTERENRRLKLDITRLGKIYLRGC